MQLGILVMYYTGSKQRMLFVSYSKARQTRFTVSINQLLDLHVGRQSLFKTVYMLTVLRPLKVGMSLLGKR